MAAPTAGFCLTVFALYRYLLRATDRLSTVLFAATIAVIASGPAAALAGATLAWCLLAVTLSPFVVVVGYESSGRRYQRRVLRRILAHDSGLLREDHGTQHTDPSGR